MPVGTAFVVKYSEANKLHAGKVGTLPFVHKLERVHRPAAFLGLGRQLKRVTRHGVI